MKPTELDFVTCEFGRPGDWMAGEHTGIDYRAVSGTPIFATKGGTVIHTGWGGYGEAYGLHVVIRSRHLLRTRQHLYAHLSSSRVVNGRKVKGGQVIAMSGETGNTFGAHLHYEERLSPFSYWDYVVPVLPQWQPVYRPVVHLERLKPGLRNKQIKRVQRRLNKNLHLKLDVTGEWDGRTKVAYSTWQHRLGYVGQDANGLPGETSLRRLGLRVKK